MIKVVRKMTLPEHRERKSIYAALGYKEIKVEEASQYKVNVTFEVDDTDPHYKEIKKLEKSLYRKGPVFFPVLLLVAISFTLLSVFVVMLAKEGESFDLLKYALSLLLPAFLCLSADVVYTIFYFQINKKIIEEAPLNNEDITSIVNKIRNK